MSKKMARYKMAAYIGVSDNFAYELEKRGILIKPIYDFLSIKKFKNAPEERTNRIKKDFIYTSNVTQDLTEHEKNTIWVAYTNKHYNGR